MAKVFRRQLAIASAALALGVSLFSIAAAAGEVRVGAGDLEIVAAPDERAALAVTVGARACPPDCGFVDIRWRSSTRIDAEIASRAITSSNAAETAVIAGRRAGG